MILLRRCLGLGRGRQDDVSPEISEVILLREVESSLADEIRGDLVAGHGGVSTYADAVAGGRVAKEEKGRKTMSNEYWVYVIQSQRQREGRNGNKLPGLFYVGMTTDLLRRLNEHNGFTAAGNPTLKGKGGKFTSQHRPYAMRAIYGPYVDRSEAQKAEYALKHKKRGQSRCLWRPEEHPLCRGLGRKDPRIEEINEKAYKREDAEGDLT